MFQQITVVADHENIFSAALRENSLKSGPTCVLISEQDARQITVPPEAILVVNKSVRSAAEPLKKLFPQAQVMVCQGGEKNFAPRLTVVHGPDDHDTHWFSSWTEFCRLVSQPLGRLEKIFVKEGEQADGQQSFAIENRCRQDDYYRLAGKKVELAALYHSMLAVSQSYLQWYLGWLQEIANLQFPCHFKLPGKKKNALVKRLFVPTEDVIVHRGLPVFREEDQLSFTSDGDEWFSATVESVGDEGLAVVFNQPCPTKATVNGFIGFQKEVNQALASQYLEFCRRTEADAGDSNPPQTAISSGPGTRWYVFPEMDIPSVVLSPEQSRKLFQDYSQQAALSDLTDADAMNLVQGPAGTGKTFLTALAVKQYLAAGKSVLLISHSNQGLDNLLAAVAEAMPGAERSIFRLGNNRKNITPKGLPYHRSVRYAFDLLDQPLDEPERVRRETAAITELGSGVIIGCTMASFLIDRTMRNLGFAPEVTIVDEASRGLFFELLPLLEATREKMVFVGDPEQLGNLDLSPEAKEYLLTQGFDGEAVEAFGRGWFNVVVEKELWPVNLLRINRRALPVLSRLISQLFYQDKLICGRFDPNQPGEFIFWDTSRAQENKEMPVGTSRKNGREANLAVDYAVRCLAQGMKPQEIGVITPYRGQIMLIRKKLRKALFCDQRLQQWRQEFGLSQDNIKPLLRQMVNTVDAFQGSERAVIILSFVCSNPRGDIGFNRNLNRLRVACTRARDRLVVIANAETFLSCDFPEIQHIFRELIGYAQESGVYREIQ